MIRDNIRSANIDETQAVVEAAAKKPPSWRCLSVASWHDTEAGEHGGRSKATFGDCACVNHWSEILILDDALVSRWCDGKQIHEALKADRQGKTTILPRIGSSVMNADEIIVFDQGRMNAARMPS